MVLQVQDFKQQISMTYNLLKKTLKEMAERTGLIPPFKSLCAEKGTEVTNHN